MTATPSEDLARLIASAKRLGVELDAAAAQQWLAAVVSSPGEEDDIVMDVKTGVFGHRVTMLDFSADELAHFRKIGKLVEFNDIPGKVETALALSGSAAQSKIQTFPGDADFFERVNIHAAKREEACQALGKLIREKAMSTIKG